MKLSKNISTKLMFLLVSSVITSNINAGFYGFGQIGRRENNFTYDYEITSANTTYDITSNIANNTIIGTIGLGYEMGTGIYSIDLEGATSIFSADNSSSYNPVTITPSGGSSYTLSDIEPKIENPFWVIIHLGYRISERFKFSLGYGRENLKFDTSATIETSATDSTFTSISKKLNAERIEFGIQYDMSQYYGIKITTAHVPKKTSSSTATRSVSSYETKIGLVRNF